MPIDISSLLKDTGSWAFLSKGMNKLFKSRVYTTAILTMLIIILVMILYPCKENTPTWVLLKLGFYVFLVSIGVIFMHDCVLFHKYKEKEEFEDAAAMGSTISGEDNIAFVSEKTNVVPEIKKIGGEITSSKDEVSKSLDVNNDSNDIIGGDTDAIFSMYGV